MSKKIQWKRTCAVIMSVCMAASNLMITDVRAEEKETAEIISGEYVILADNTQDDIVEEVAQEKEIVQSEEAVVYEAELSKQEIKELEQEEITVEENIFLFGAESKKHAKKHSKEEKKLSKKEIKEKQEQYKKKRQLAEELFKDDTKEQGTDWNYQMINSDEAEETDTQKQAVKVAILDSGVELLSGIPVSGSVNLVEEEQDLPYYMNDMTGHGTAVADIVHQICPDAQLYAVRVLDRENKGRLSDIVEGIYWCIDHEIDIINMSFGTSKDSEILQSAIAEASAHGIMIVGSAGNGGSESDVEYPAAFEEVIAVGAVDTSAKRTQESATGPEVELVAPGEQILTKSMLGMETVNSGTSMAAPHVTGAAAVLMQQDSEKSSEQIREALKESGNPLGDEEEYGNGIVDVAYAQEILEEMPEEGSTLSENTVSGNTTLEEAVREPVETFEEIDYVEGRWGTDQHRELVKQGLKEYGGFNSKEIKIFKAGAVYQDSNLGKIKGAKYFPEWHGRYDSNYVANFIFATKIAKKAGDTSNISRARGQSVDKYNSMKNAVSTSGINGVKWARIFEEKTGYDYKAQSKETKKRWRKLFLYGMAAHIATDVFAHSTMYKDGNGQYIIIDHTDKRADNPSVYPNRYKCAELTAYWVVQECQENWTGDVLDFSAYGEKCWKGFYLKEILYYANEADNCYGTDWLKEEYKAVDYSTNPIKWKDCVEIAIPMYETAR